MNPCLALLFRFSHILPHDYDDVIPQPLPQKDVGLLHLFAALPLLVRDAKHLQHNARKKKDWGGPGWPKKLPQSYRKKCLRKRDRLDED